MEIKNCSTLKNIEIGDVLYMRPIGNARYWHPREQFIKGVVTKIGRKYFTVNRGVDGLHSSCEERFTIDAAQCVNDDNYGYILYKSQEEFERDSDRDAKFNEIRKYFGQSFRKKDPSYEAICQIYELMKGEGLL